MSMLPIAWRKRILVTGGAGYIGSVMVPRLLEEGHLVRVLDNFMYGQTSLLGCCHYPGLEIVRGDVRVGHVLKDALKDVDFILPLAAIVGAPACEMNPVTAVSTNYDAIEELLALRYKEQAIILPCTNSGYGVGQDELYCTEETPLNPISLYGRLKADAERAVIEAGNSISLRLATVFGVSPRMRTDLLVNDFVLRAVTDGFTVLYQGHFKRNYIHIKDVARAFIHCIENFDRMKNEVYNVGLSNANLSKKELCQEIKKQVPSFYFVEAEVGEDIDQRNYIVSNKKIEAAGFKPRISLKGGIAELIKAYQILKHAVGNV